MTSSQSTATPAVTSRQIRTNGVVIPANTHTTAFYSNGEKPLMVIHYQGRSYYVPTTAVRFI